MTNLNLTLCKVSFTNLFLTFFIALVATCISAQSINVQNLCAGQGQVELQGSPAGGTWSGNNVTSNGFFNTNNANLGSNPVTYNPPGPNNTVSKNLQVQNCQDFYIEDIFNPCGTDRSLESSIEGLLGAPDLCRNVQNTSNVTKVIAEIWVEEGECGGVFPDFMTFSFDGQEFYVGGEIVEQVNGQDQYPEKLFRYLYEGNPSEVCVDNPFDCTVTTLALYVERDVPDATSSFTTYDFELHTIKTPGEDNCVIDSLLLGENDVERNITIGIPIHEKDNTREVTVLVEILTDGSDVVLASNTEVYTDQNAGAEASLYNFIFEDVPGGANIARVTVCSPHPDGDSFGVGSITASTFEVCITCQLAGDAIGDEICNGEAATITMDYNSTSYEADDNPNTPKDVFYAWEDGSTTASIDVSPTETTKYYCTITDELGCTVLDSATVTVSEAEVEYDGDEEFCEDAGVQELGGASPDGGTYSGPGVSDNNDGSSYDFDPAAAGAGDHEVLYEYTDDDGCFASGTIMITVFPELSISTAAECNDAQLNDIDLIVTGGSANYTFSWTGPDNFTASSEDVSDLEPGTYFVTVTDENGCMDTANETVEACCLPLTIVCPSDQTIQCYDSDAPMFTGEPIISEGCGEVNVTFLDSNEAGSCANERVITRTWTAEDEDGNEISCGQTITVIDTEGPEFEAPPVDVTIDCLTDLPANIELDWMDNCDGAGSILGEDESDGNTCPEIITRTWAYTDGCGNPASVSQSITIDDNENPEIETVFADQELGCNPNFDEPTFTVVDNCIAGTVEVVPTTNGPEEDGFCGFIQEWTANYTDACGNAAVPVTITYRWTEDKVNPVISNEGDADGTIYFCTIPDAPTFSVLEACSPLDDEGSEILIAVVASEVTSNNDCDQSRTWTASYMDGCGNVAEQVAVTYIWKEDATNPVITNEGDPSSTDYFCVIPQAPTFSVRELCSPLDEEGNTIGIDVTTTGPTITDDCNHTQTWSATYTDGCGNTAEPISVTYEWKEDAANPIISNEGDPTDTEYYCNVPQAPPFSVDEMCSPLDEEGNVIEVEVNSSGPTTADNCNYTQTWTANYTDGCGNTATPLSVTYEWIEDDTNPVITNEGDPTDSDYFCSEPDAPTFSVLEACSPMDEEGNVIEIEVSTNGPSTTDECNYTQTWTATYTDGCGNAADPVSVTYVWKEDAADPIITNEGDPTDSDYFCSEPDAPTFSVVEACSPMDEEGSIIEIEVSTNGPSTTDECNYTQTWTATYTDGCGNAADPVSVTYVWKEDAANPIISNQGDVTGTDYFCTIPDAPSFSVDEVCSPIDEDGNTIEIDVETTGKSSTDNCNYSQTWTATYTDGCGNAADPISVTYFWKEDDVLPVISNTGDEDGSDYFCAVPEAPTFSVLETCSPLDSDGNEIQITVTASDVTSNNECDQSRTWTATYTDGCGNVAEAVSVTYTWKEDAANPIISNQVDATGTDYFCTIPDAPSFSVDEVCSPLDEDGNTIEIDVTTPGKTSTDDCTYTQTWTASYTDGCGNSADPVSVTYSWKEDDVLPVISNTGDEDGSDYFCAVPEAPTFSVLETCSPLDSDGNEIQITVTASDVTSNNECDQSRTWTATYTDGCGNVAEAVSVTYTWKEDAANPIISNQGDVTGTDYFCTIPDAPSFSVDEVCSPLDEDGNTIEIDVTTLGKTSTDDCTYTQTWTASYTDGCGNSADPVSVTYSWKEDDVLPVISNTGDEDGSDYFCAVPEAPTFSVLETCSPLDADGNEIQITVTASDVTSNNECDQSRTWTATYTDGCGNVAEAVSVTYSWKEDAANPIISNQGDATGTDYFCTIPDAPTFSVLEACSPIDEEGNVIEIEVNTSGPVIADNCNYTQTWTATYTDGCGNVADPVSVTYVWKEDETNPVITNEGDPTDSDYFCSQPDAPTFSVLEACSPMDAEGNIIEIEVSTTGPSTTDECSYTQTWIASYTDGCGNAAEDVSVTYEWKDDSTNPVIMNEGDLTGTDYGCVIPEPPTFSVSETCSPLDEEGNVIEIEVNSSGPTTEDNCNYTQTWTATYTDGCGNSAVASSVTYAWIEDEEAPILIVALEPLDLGCNPDNITFSDPVFDMTCSEVEDVEGYPILSEVTIDGCLRSQTKTWRVTDCSGLVTEESQTATWSVDDEDPVISFVNPMLLGFENGDVLKIQCYGQNPNWQLPEASINDVSVSDNCLADVDVTVTEVKIGDGNCEEDGYIQKLRCSWTATDACGNSSLLFIFMEIVDTIAPVISGVPGDITITCEDDIFTPNVTAEDECLCADLTFSEEIIEGDCIEDRKVIRTWTATDCCGNESSETQVISYSDELAPTLVVALPGDITIDSNLTLEFDCNSGGIPAEYEDLSAENGEAVELCSGEAQISFSNTSEEFSECNNGFVEVHTLTWTAFDACGNEQEVTLTINVVDNTPPVFYGAPAFVCGDDGSDLFVYVIDACTNARTSHFDRVLPGSCGLATERTYTAWDRCGNYSSFVQIIVFEDTISPTITLTSQTLAGLESGDTISIQCGSDFSPVGLEDALFTDECNRPLNTTFEERDQGNAACVDGALSVVELVWTASDICGNSTELIVYAQRIDEVAPTFLDFEEELTVSCDREIEDMEAEDGCSDVSLDYADQIVPSDCPGTYDIMRTVTAEDACGNVATVQQLIHVVDNAGPIFHGLEEYVCEDMSMPAVYALDNCGNQEIEVSMVEDTLFNESCGDELLIRRMWTASDACGNTSEFEQIISLFDSTAPELLYNEQFQRLIGYSRNVYLSNISEMEYVNSIRWYSVMGRDECTGEIILPQFTENTIVSENCAEDGWVEQRIYRWEVSDACGNAADVQLNLNIIDDLPPELDNLPASANFGCDPIPDLGSLEPPTFMDMQDTTNGSITFTEVMDMSDDIMTITNTWMATDVCGNRVEAVQVLQSIIASDLTSSIVTEENIRCNTHGNLVSADVTGGDGPFTYQWNIEGTDCQIQSGQGTEEIEVYVGFNTAVVTLEVTDANNCVTFSEKTIECLTKGESSLAISGLTPNPATTNFQLRVISDQDREVQYQISNVLGAHIVSTETTLQQGENTMSLDIDDYPAGTYIIKITNGESSASRKFIKIK